MPNKRTISPTRSTRLPASAFVTMLVLLNVATLPAADPVTYIDHIRPLFAANCLACHNPDKTRGGLDLSTYAGVMAGSSGGQVVSVPDASASRLYGVISHTEEPFMPRRSGKLPDDQIELVKKWIEQGCLESPSSTPARQKKSTVDLALNVVPTGPPDGPPIMPTGLPFGPAVQTRRPGVASALACHPWSPLVAICGQKQTVIYDSGRRELVGVLAFSGGFPKVLQFTRNGRYLMVGGGVGGQSGTVVLYAIDDGREVFSIGKAFDTVLAAAIDPAQSRVAIGGPSGVVKIYSTRTGKEIHRIEKHTDWITTVAYSTDGILLATADRNGGLFVWEAESFAPFYALAGHTGAVTDLSWRDDSNVLASTGADGKVRLWEMFGGTQIKNFPAHSGGAESVHFAHDGRLVTAGRDNTVKIWDQQGKQIRAFDPFDSYALTAGFDADGKQVIAGDFEGHVRIWSADDGRHLADLVVNPPSIEQQLDNARKHLADATKRVQNLDDTLASAAQAAGTVSGAATLAEQVYQQLIAALAVATSERDQAQAAANNARTASKAGAERISARRPATTAAQAEVPKVLGELQAAVDHDLAIHHRVQADRESAAKFREEAKAAHQDAQAKPDDAAIAESAKAADARARAAVAVLAESESAAQASSARVREALARSDSAKERLAEEIKAQEEATEAVASLEQLLASAVAATGPKGEALQNAQANVEAARADRDRKVKEAEDARHTASEAERAGNQGQREVRVAEAMVAKWQAARLRLDLDQARIDSARQEAQQAPIAEKARESREVAEELAAALESAEQALANAPQRMAALQAVADGARQSSVQAGECLARLEQLVGAKTSLIAEFRSTVERARSQAAAEAENQTIAQAVVKVEESLALLNKDFAEAIRRLEDARNTKGQADRDLETAKQQISQAEQWHAALPGSLASLKADSAGATERASADQAAAVESQAPVDAAEAAVKEQEARYAELLAVYMSKRDG